MSKIEGPSGSINNIVCQTLNIIIRPTEILINHSSNNKHSVRPFYFFIYGNRATALHADFSDSCSILSCITAEAQDGGGGGVG